MNPSELRKIQEWIADSIWEPVIHVKTDRGEWWGGWQAFADWMVIHRPRTVEVSVVEWEDLADLFDDLDEETQS